MERGQALPGWFDEEPELGAGEEFYLNSFWRLSTERPIGFAAGPIPWSKIQEYGQRAGLDSDMMAVFSDVIQAMDKTYLEWTAEEMKRQREAGK